MIGTEKPQVWLEVDLDTSLRYARGLVVVTDRRILALGGEYTMPGRGKAYWFMAEPLMMAKSVFDKLPKDQQEKARRTGLLAAMGVAVFIAIAGFRLTG